MNIKFINYTGRYPNLCSGQLTLEIDGAIYKFGGSFINADPRPDFPSFWTSGGYAGCNGHGDELIESGPWIMGYNKEAIKKIDLNFYPNATEQFLEIMNQNVTNGCCGGCI